MILIHRTDEPALLAEVRAEQLKRLRLLGRVPSADDIKGYRVAAGSLWRMQHFKCCYCEHKVKSGFNDVEHYRPKGRAAREPGSARTHGYWWLAFTWCNLLFACASCNRSGKNDDFPLADDITLFAEDAPPGGEKPLLIDPSGSANPILAIRFTLESLTPSGPQYWYARPRAGDRRGSFTISTLKLNAQDLLELRTEYANTVVREFIEELRMALNGQDDVWVRRAFERALALLRPTSQYVALTYDVFRSAISDGELVDRLGTGWPAPNDVPLR